MFTNLWSRWLSRSSPASAVRRRPSAATTRRFRPALEMLELRIMPATYFVNTVADLSIQNGVNAATGAIVGSAQNVTLRSAIDAANMTPGGNTIELMVHGTYQIALAGANTGGDATGAFAILPSGGNLTIVNASGGAVTVDGNHLDRVFDINPTFNFNAPTPEFTVTMQGFTITNGVASPGDGAAGSGGGIRDQGNASLTLTNMVVTNNVATADGGGVSMENIVSVPWKLTVNNSVISNNHAGDAGGGIETDGTGKVFINAGTVITGNTCVNQGAGIWLDAISGIVSSVTILSSGVDQYFLNDAPTVAFTAADANGGSGAQGTVVLNANFNVVGVTITNPGSGYYMAPTVSFTDQFVPNPDTTAVANLALNQSATLTVTGTLISNNHALTGPGGGIGNAGSSAVTIVNSTIENNSAGMVGGGFGDQNNLGTLVVANSLFLNNVAVGDGGGIAEGGPTTSITSSQITGNASGAKGGGVFAAGTTLFVQDSTIANNTASGDGVTQGGGGIELLTIGTGLQASTITNTTITGNRALNNAGGDFGVVGGGIDAVFFNGDLVLQNDTINANYAAAGGGIILESNGSVSLQNTILAGNFSLIGADAINDRNPFNDLGGNLIGVGGPPGFNSFVATGTTQAGSFAAPLNPLLAPLGNYGGPTIGAPGATQVLQTEALQTGSPGIGHGTLFGTPAFDERGSATLVNGAVSVGAVSLVVSPPTVTTHSGASPVISSTTVNGVTTTTYVVNTTADFLTQTGNLLSLRAAINDADGIAGNKIIKLTVPGGDYKITLPGANTATGATGAFAILPSGGNVSILNASGGTATVDGNHLDRVFDINPADDMNFNDEFTVTLQGITITNGIAQTGDGPAGSGGGIRDQGIASLTLNNVIVTNNLATADGGGISMENTVSSHWVLTINASIISDNHAGDAGGGVETDGSGKVFIDAGTVITGNTCVNQGAGIWLDAIQVGNVFQGASLAVTGAVITDNQALNMLGGGIGNAGNGPVTITNCTVENNFSAGAGGGFADANNQGTLTVTNSLFLNNIAVGSGGAIQEGGPTTTITSTQITGNASGNSGGAIFADGTTLTVKQSTIALNTASGDGNGLGGGGIELQTTGSSSITSTTITGNRALNSAGANGGGIDATNLAGSVTLLNNTLNANFASNGGGIFWGGMTGSVFSLQNTIVALDFLANGGAGVDVNNLAGAFTDLGGNLIGVAGDGNTGFTAGTTQTGSLANPLNPLLGPLGNNGGPMIGAPGTMIVLQTKALTTGSKALGKGIKTGATLTDERGVKNGTVITVGAVNV